jgi:hypothetical protein
MLDEPENFYQNYKLELNGDSTVANLRMKNGPTRIWSGRERRG